MTAQPMPAEAFHSTHWSLIRGLDAADADGRSRFNALCLRYWAPVHQHILDCGHPEEAARDLTRRFFTRLHTEGLSRAARYSRFRNFLAGELDAFLAQAGPPPDPPSTNPAGHGDTSLERGLALEVLSQSMARLRHEATAAGHLPMFERLQHYLSVEPQADDLKREAEALAATPLFVSLAVRRLRQHFRRIVDDELTQMVADPAQLAEERAAMFAALAHPR
jgi:hypothetical protein